MLPRLTARLLTLLPALLLALSLSGCHLIFRYEDRADSGAPQPDLAQPVDGLPDAARPDLGAPDQADKPDGPPRAWTVIPTSTSPLPILGLWGPSSKDIYLVGWKGAILRYSGGKNFTPLKSGTKSTLYGVAKLGSSNFMAVGEDATVRICDTSTQLCSLADPTGGDAASFSWSAVWCSSSGKCYLGGWVLAEGGAYMRSGATWTSICGTLADKPVSAVWGLSDSEVYMGDSTGRIIRYSGPGGCKVVYKSGGAVGSIHALWASSKGVLAAGTPPGPGSTGKAAGVWISGGKTTTLKLGPYATIRAVHGRVTKGMVLAGDDAALFFDGKDLTDLKAPKISGSKPKLQAVFMTASGNIFAGDASGNLLRYK